MMITSRLALFCAGIMDKGATYANLGEINQAGYDVVESRTKIEGCYTLFVDGTFYTLQSEEKDLQSFIYDTGSAEKAGFDTDGVLLKKCRDCGVITSRISIPKVSNVSLLQTVFTL